MPEESANGQEVRAVLAKWTTHDWRRGFALAPSLEDTIRRGCNIHQRQPLLDGAGVLAMTVLTRLGKLSFQELLNALSPLALQLETRLSQAAVASEGDFPAALKALAAQSDVGPGLTKLAACRLGLQPSIAGPPDAAREPAGSAVKGGAGDVARRDLVAALAELEAQQPLVVEAAQRLVADAESGRPTGEEDIALIRHWNDGLVRAASLVGSEGAPTSLPSLRAFMAVRVQAASDAERLGALVRTLCEIADAAVTAGAREVLATAMDEAAAAATDPGAVDPGRHDAFLALHRLLSTSSWDVTDEEVEAVEAAFGRRIARVALAEVAIGVS